jgi:hypothetical protein
LYSLMWYSCHFCLNRQFVCPPLSSSIFLVNDQLDTLFLNVFISCLYMFRATSDHHQEGQIVLIHHLV